MRIIVVYILIFFVPVSLSAQPKKSLYDKGFQFLINKNEDAAYRYFKKSFKKESNHRTICLNFMADIEYKRGLIKEAEEKYKSILTTYKDNYHYLQYWVHLKVADIYIERGDYKGALTYLRGSEEHKNKHGCGTGKYDQEYELRYKYALCFNGLNELDSAILKLSPFMFKECPLLTEKSDHFERNAFYYQLLVKKYGICAVKDETLRAIANLNYSSSYDVAWTGDHKMKRIQCRLSFFGETIRIADFGYSGKIDDYLYSKEYFMVGIRKTPLFGMIVAGSDL